MHPLRDAIFILGKYTWQFLMMIINHDSACTEYKKNGSYVRNWYFRVQICINVRVQFISKVQKCMAQHGPEEQVIITMEMESGRSLLDKSLPQHFALLPWLLMHRIKM